MIKKQLKKIYRFFFVKEHTPDELFEIKLQQNILIKELKKERDFYIAKKINLSIAIRNREHSDYEVFQQIFNIQEYKIVLSLYNNNFCKNEECIIIDAGANVGYTALYFLDQLPEAKIFGIEPSPTNMSFYRKNISLNNYNNQVVFYENALAEVENKSFIIDNSFRDGKDWSTATQESPNGTVNGITINEIIKNNLINKVSILKIDIEGAERFIFNNNSDLSFLEITEIIAIEIHDEYEVRSQIYKILSNFGFILLESGELTIGLNKKYL
jgi:FkbM family methyltransferase